MKFSFDRLLWAVTFCLASFNALGQKPPDSSPPLVGLNTEGVEKNMQWRLRVIAEGRQDKMSIVDLDRRSPNFQVLLDGYITAYGLACSAYLPADKVEWTIKKCDEFTRNSNDEIECVREGEHHTHVYVDKNLLDLKHQLLLGMSGRQEITPNGIRAPLPDLQEAIDNALNPQIRRYYSELWISPGQLVRANGCLSPELHRFQENLIRHGLGIPMLTTAVPPVSPPRIPPATSPPLPSGRLSFQKLNYLQLIIDMKNIKDNQGRAAFEDMPVDSIKNIHPVRFDTEGKPIVIEADCRIDWDDGHPPPCEGLVLLMTSTGYPMCMRMKSKKLDQPSDPPCVRSVIATDAITAKYQAGGYSQ